MYPVYQRMWQNEESEEKSLLESCFIGKVRGILDSKFNEMLYFRQIYHQIPFCDFVYSWLGKFKIGKSSKSIELQKVTDIGDKDITRGRFFFNLNSSLSQKLWECLNF